MIYIGTSGFSYDDWKCYFYPEHLPKKEMLAYYASNFNTVEINSTYYAIPPSSTFATMDNKTPHDFRFVVKAHKDMTHIDNPQDATFDAFLTSIEPIRESGKLGCILAQYPWGYKYNPENIDRIKELRDRVGDLPTVVEFRNEDWVNDDTFQLLRELKLGFCCVDEPRLKGLMPSVAEVTSDISYVRFHGRNAKEWWKHEEAYQRYNYLYSQEELEEWVPKVEDINQHSQTTYLFFNNHYQGKSVQNARMFSHMLNLSLPKPSIQQMTFLDQ